MRGTLAAITLTLAGCATAPIAQPPVLQPVNQVVIVQPPSQEELDTVMRRSKELYLASMNPANYDVTDGLREQATDALKQADALCARMPGCADVAARVIDDVIAEQMNRNLTPATMETPEPQTPVSPETPTLRKGESIDRLVELNGTLKETLVRHWLVNYRDDLIHAYIRFRFVEGVVRDAYEKEDLPIEIGIALGTQETFFKQSTSRAGARGAWQIMPGTGREYGLKPDDLFRFDKATVAHVAMFSDWLKRLGNDVLLATSAYNGGPNRLDRLSNGGKRTVWQIFSSLPGETKAYVKNVAAAMEIMHDLETNAGMYKITLPNVDTTLIDVTLPTAASIEELHVCLGNPSEIPGGWFHILSMVNPQYAPDPYAQIPAGSGVRIPRMAEGAYAECFAGPLWDILVELRTHKRATYAKEREYRVREGDTLAGIAAKVRECGQSYKQIAARNKISSPYLLQTGKVLKIPCAK